MTTLARINSIRPVNTAAARSVQAPFGLGAVAWSNLGLAFAALLLLMYYVMQVNMLAASTWRLKDMRSQLSALRQERTTLVAQVAELADRPILEALARNSGFVPADAVVYLVQPSAVAAR